MIPSCLRPSKSVSIARAARAALAGLWLATLVEPASAQQAVDPSLVARLQQGGHVLVMRHASSPRETPSAQTARPDNRGLERQLDEAGRRAAAAMGAALRTLKIRIGSVLMSPTYRAMETVAVAGLSGANVANELGDNGQSVNDAQIAWLRQIVTERPRSGNTIMVTHQPNISRAFPDSAAEVAEGEAIVFQPDGKGGVTLIGRIPIDVWPRLSLNN